MQSIVTVTTAASSYDLTTLANVKAELDITDGSSDAILRRYIASASKAASQYCNRVFASETISEVFVPDRFRWKITGGIRSLQLARWPVISVTSVTEDGTALGEDTDYKVDKATAQLTRISDTGYACDWYPLPLTVVYVAGFATIPADVEDATIRMVTKRWMAKGRDATLKQEAIPGVIERQYWIASGTEAGNLSPDIADVLDNYRTPVAL